jgi:hypothetical protein
MGDIADSDIGLSYRPVVPYMPKSILSALMDYEFDYRRLGRGNVRVRVYPLYIGVNT